MQKMESPKKAENKDDRARIPEREAQNDSEEDVTPPSPIQIASEPASVNEFGVAEAGEGKRIAVEYQNRLKTILEVAGVTGLTDIDARTFQDPEILRKLTNSVSSALDEATTALTRMKSEKQTYEAFLRGANQTPHTAPVSMAEQQQQLLHDQQQQQHQHAQQQLPPLQQHPQQLQPPSQLLKEQPVLPLTSGIVMPPTSSLNTSNSLLGAKGGGNGKGMSQQKLSPPSLQQHQHLQFQKQQQQQQQQQQSLQPTTADSMQTVQRLLTQGHTIQEATEDGESLLSLACSAGYYELAEVLLRMRASVEERGLKGQCEMKGDSTPLMEAASGGYSDIVKLLIDHGANVNAKSSVGNTALTYACCGGYEEVVHTLLKARADVEHQNDNGHTPLMEAASCGHVGVAKLLLDYGANINTHSNEFKESALTLACYKGHLEMVKFLLGAGADQEHKTDEMHTALMEASMDGHVDVARLLLDHGAQVNMPADSFESPLTLAACGGHYELAALLLSRGADLGEVNDEGYTPLMESAREGHEDVVKLLVEHGAKVNAQSEETQETALGLASCGGFLDVVQYLVENEADIELGASTPLMEAAQEGHINIIRYLIEKKANVRAVTNTGDSALTYACAHGHSVIAELLLQHGAELEHESEGGRTPLMKAARAGHLPTVKFLVAKGADVNRRTTNNDHTVLSLASAGGHVGVVQFLLSRGAEPSHMLRDNSTMLIEASRGGHTSVAHLLLKQPKETSPEATPSMSPTSSIRNIPGGHGAVAGDPSTLAGTAMKGSKVRQSIYRGSDNGVGRGGAGMEVTSRPVLRHEHSGSELGGGMADDDLNELTTSKAKRPKVANESNSGLVSSGSSHSLQYPQYPAPIRAKSKAQQVQQGHLPAMKTASGGSVQYATDSASAMKNVQNWSNMSAPSPFSSSHNSPLSFSKQRQQQEDEELASQMAAIVNYSHLIPDEIMDDHVTHDELVARRIYSTPEKLTMRPGMEHQQVPASLTQGLAEEPPLDSTRSLFTSGTFTSQLPIPNSAHSPHTRITPSDSGGFVSVPEPTSVTCDSPLTGSSQIGIRGEGVGEPRRGVLPSQEEARVPGTMFNPDAMFASPPSGSERLNSTLPSIDNKLIPHLEALADLLQNPSTLENQYLLALAARAQLFSSSLSTPGDGGVGGRGGGASGEAGETDTDLPSAAGQESPLLPNSLETLAAIAAHISQGNDPASLSKGFPGALEALASLTSQLPDDEKSVHSNMDIINLLSSGVDLTKLLPMLAALEMQGSIGMEPDNSGGLKPITDPSLVKKLWDEMHCVESNPGYMGGLVGEGGLSAGEGERAPHPLDYLNEHLRSVQGSGGGVGRLPKHQYPLALLDGNFPLDIPPPGELGDEERHQLTAAGLQSGYISPLEQESFPTSEDEDEEDDDEEDDEDDDENGEDADLDGEDSSSSYLAQDLSMPSGNFLPAINIDQQTESNHDTALTLAAAGGYDELVDLLISRGANLEHRDKKGCTPLILAASGGYPVTVAILLEHNADIEAQSDRTKDTALSLACSGGKQEVVELLLNKGANFEHRNVSDYTPLSLAASGGYVHIIKLLLKEGADINSRTGSKLGISPLMLAAMNGHTSTVKLLLDRGSDINAQIETNRNTALTLACFQGRHEVVQLLVDRNANVEHRAKTGLTPLMEAASGGYHEVGKVLINKGADVNAAPVPSSKDTALTIAADKGHYKFVDLILRFGAHVDVKNKKGNSPLWLAANGGHLDVVRLLVEYKADVDSQDNRKVSCLMAAFRKGHEKVIRYLVKHVSQFPSDSELTRYINTLSDPDHAKKCEKCVEAVITAKEEQANKAIKNADKLLEEIDAEKKHEEDRKAAAARKRAKKKRQKEKKKAQKEAEVTNGVIGGGDTPPEDDAGGGEEGLQVDVIEQELQDDKEDSLDTTSKRVSPHRTANSITHKSSQTSTGTSVSNSNSNSSSTNNSNTSNQQHERVSNCIETSSKRHPDVLKHSRSIEKSVGIVKIPDSPPVITLQKSNSLSTSDASSLPASGMQRQSKRAKERERERGESSSFRCRGNRSSGPRARSQSSGSSDAHAPPPAPSTSTVVSSPMIRVSSSAGVIGVAVGGTTPTSSPRKGKKEDGWKEVGRRTKKVSIPVAVYNQVLGKNSTILASIKQATNTQIDVDKHTRQSSNRILTVRGSADAIKLAQVLLISLTKDPNQDVQSLIQKQVGPGLSSNALLSPSVSSNTTSNKRHVTSSQGLPLSVPQDIMDSVAPPAKGSNAVVASVNAAISSMVTLSDSASTKPGSKKTAGGPSASHGVSAPSAASKAPVERLSAGSSKTSSGQGSAYPGKHLGYSGGIEHVPTSKAGLIPLPTASTLTTVAGVPSSALQVVSSGYINNNTGTNTLPVFSSKSAATQVSVSVGGQGGSVARRLFHQQPGNAGPSVETVGMPSSNTSLLGPQPVNYPSHPSSSVHQGHQMSLPKSTSALAAKSFPHAATVQVGSLKQQKSKHPDAHAPSLAIVKEKAPPVQQPQSKGSGKMHYSNVINPGSTSGTEISSSAPVVVGGMTAADVIEQPMHQIMNTPMLFQDQITRTKKKSTYSDAVGKKNDASSGQSSKAVSMSAHSNIAPIGPLPPLQQQQQQPKLNLAPGTRPLVSGNTVDKQQQQQQQQGASVPDPKLGGSSRPMSAWNDVAGITTAMGSQIVGPPGPANERPRPPSRGIPAGLEDFQKLGLYSEEASPPHSVACGGGLGPIGPPSRNSKVPLANIPPPLPPLSNAHAGVSGKGPSSGPASIHSFSPSTVHGTHPKTSPPTPSPSQRNEISPATKSPLLGPAPPGFPPPDNKSGLYFKPIQQQVAGGEMSQGGESPNPNSNPTGGNNNYPTLVPTPVRAPRPPLLATPPGYYGSPGPSPEKNSPNKSPPHPIIKGSNFNPNAPSFVPMALQQRSSNLPPTSSILGPPPIYPPTYSQGTSGGSSILGNAPQLPGAAGGGPPFNTAGGPGSGPSAVNQQPQIMGPSVFAGQGAPPPPPPPVPSQQPPQQQQQQPPQPQQQPLASQQVLPTSSHSIIHTTSSASTHQGAPQPIPSNQSSILGQPPTPPLNPHMYPPHQQGGPQNFHGIPSRPLGSGSHGQAPLNASMPMFSHQLEAGSHPLPPSHPPTGSAALPPSVPPGNFGGLNMVPQFQIQPSNGPQSNMHRQPVQNIGSSVKDSLSSSLDPGGIGNILSPIAVGGPSSSASQFVPVTSSDFNKFGMPSHHYSEKPMDDILVGFNRPGTHSILLPMSHGPNPPSGVIGGEIASGVSNREGGQLRSGVSALPTDNFFGMSLKQLGGLNVAQVEGRGGKDGIMTGRGRSLAKGAVGAEKFPSSAVLEFPMNSMDSSTVHFTSGSSMLNSGTVVTPSTSYYMLAPGVLPSSTDNSKRDSTMVPIGAERAQKSAALQPAAAFPGFSPNVWSYSSQHSASEESDWLTHLPGHLAQKTEVSTSVGTGGSQPPSGGEIVITPQDTLESVLQKLSLDDHLPLFKQNEIDLNALKLMNETDFAEIGLPSGPCQKLLNAMKASSTYQPPPRLQEFPRTSSASNQALPYSENSSRSSSRPATRPSSRQQHSD